VIKIRKQGCYWEVDSSNNLTNEHIKNKLSRKAQKITNLFLEEIDEFVWDLHSVYISGSYVTRTETENSDIDYLVIVNNSEYVESLEIKLKNVYSKKISKIVKEKLNEDIHIDIGVYHIDEFKSDYPNRFIHKCVRGEDLSMDTISFDLLTFNNLDGLELSDLNYLRKINKEVIDFIDNYWETEKNEIDLSIQHYTKLLLRCCFNTICIEKKIWTRSPYYCYYFFSQEFPEVKNLTMKVLEFSINPTKPKEEMKKILRQSLFLIRHIQERIEIAK